MKFFSRMRKPGEYTTPPMGDEFPQMILLQSDWDDYGYHTTFDIHYYATRTNYEKYRSINIVHADEKWTRLEPDFDQVPEGFVSVGNSVDYYKWIDRHLGRDQAIATLAALHDVVAHPEYREEAQQMPGFRTSALRFSEAENAFHRGGAVLGLLRPADEPFRFRFSCGLFGFVAEHALEVDFSPMPGDVSDVIPNRIFCLVGKNGTGKSGVLSRLALTLSGIEPQAGIFEPSRPIFRRTICVSYSPFQPFEVPQLNTGSYLFCGMRKLDYDALSKKTVAAFTKVIKKDRLAQWRKLVHLEDITGHLGEEAIGDVKSFENCLVTLSTGQRMVAIIATDLVAALDNECLVLIDEPEVYLHPTLLSTFLRVLEGVLREYDSYAIIATHSPIVVQEVPSRNVRVFDKVDGAPRIRPVGIESFGSNLTDLNDRVFSMNADDKNYQLYLRRAAQELGSTSRVRKLFVDPPLSLNAHLYLDALAEGDAEDDDESENGDGAAGTGEVGTDS